MFAVAQAPPDHAHRLWTQRNRRTSFCGRRSRCGADLIAAVGDRCPVGATADGSRADDGRCCIPASGPLAGPRGRRCSSVEGAYPNAGAPPSHSGIRLRHTSGHDQRQREQNWSIGADHGRGACQRKRADSALGVASSACSHSRSVICAWLKRSRTGPCARCEQKRWPSDPGNVGHDTNRLAGGQFLRGARNRYRCGPWWPTLQVWAKTLASAARSPGSITSTGTATRQP